MSSSSTRPPLRLAGARDLRSRLVLATLARRPIEIRRLRADAERPGLRGDEASFGDECRPYVGELPGLAALDGLGAAAGPAAVLGTDVLRTRPRLWYTPTRIFI